MQGLSGVPSSQRPAHQHLILAGGGHSHALVLRSWAMRAASRPASTLVSLVSRRSTAPYSGMVPGLVAGLYGRDACAIDLRRLCALAGVTFILAEIEGLNLERRELRLAGRPPLRFDQLSLDVGAVTAAAPGGMAVKPLEPFLDWAAALSADQPLRIRGGGAAAVELALAFRARGIVCRLLLRGPGLQLGSGAANRAAERLLVEAGIPVERNVSATAPADLLCTGSLAPGWLAASGLPVEAATGRVLTQPTLAVIDHPGLFAVGDCGVIADTPRPASGVWAVRAAPLLAANLKRSLEQPHGPLKSWRPQPLALQLLGDGGWRVLGAGGTAPRALAMYGPLVLGPSAWIWRWKQSIDRRFMARFHDLNGLAEPPLAAHPSAAPPLPCRGCAAKLAAAPLAGALARLGHLADPLAAAAEALDAAVVGHDAGGAPLLQSVDGFPALVDDPWVNARLTTLHACSDLWACGALVQSVQALVTVPEASASLQEELLLQTLAGIRSVLDPLGARLIGGHTLEGRDGAGLSLALTVNGPLAAALAQDDGLRAPWPKGPLRPGEVLLLSRAIGSGVLFAAAMAGAARPEWIDAALETLQQSQAPLVDLLAAHGCRACTDITGFGLLGHLGEMLATGSGHRPAADRRHRDDDVRVAGPGHESPQHAPVSIELDASAIPALPGALLLLERGFASSLAPSNAHALALLDGPIRLTASAPQRALLVDPQTCGPLLAALPADRAIAALEALHSVGFEEASLIGRVIAPQSS